MFKEIDWNGIRDKVIATIIATAIIGGSAVTFNVIFPSIGLPTILWSIGLGILGTFLMWAVRIVRGMNKAITKTLPELIDSVVSERVTQEARNRVALGDSLSGRISNLELDLNRRLEAFRAEQSKFLRTPEESPIAIALREGAEMYKPRT